MRHSVVILGRTIALSQTAPTGGGETAPEWILILPAGQNRVEDGDPILMDAEAARLVLENFKNLSHDMVFDYEHQTMGDGDA